MVTCFLYIVFYIEYMLFDNSTKCKSRLYVEPVPSGRMVLSTHKHRFIFLWDHFLLQVGVMCFLCDWLVCVCVCVYVCSLSLCWNASLPRGLIREEWVRRASCSPPPLSSCAARVCQSKSNAPPTSAQLRSTSQDTICLSVSPLLTMHSHLKFCSRSPLSKRHKYQCIEILWPYGLSKPAMIAHQNERCHLCPLRVGVCLCVHAYAPSFQC